MGARRKRSSTASTERACARLEGYEPFRVAAAALGLDVLAGDLEGSLPFADDSIDLVVSNQVIEHLADTDSFVAEIRRVLRPGGMAVVSTENMASWHKSPRSSSLPTVLIIELLHRRYPLGNPLGLHAGENATVVDGMLHRRIFTTRALRELFAAHGFSVIDVRGSGYHPCRRSSGA